MVLASALPIGKPLIIRDFAGSGKIGAETALTRHRRRQARVTEPAAQRRRATRWCSFRARGPGPPQAARGSIIGDKSWARPKARAAI